ncbi:MULTISPECIES: hypothetical protein [Methylosinus]|uniref:hypothetical protein n=1 Tax=Methylosinus TaxID=425 RepID=UPI0011B1F3C1|nr:MULTISPECIES: hypothetical protein [Methylosinus]MBU3889847.1 hypothetical protein [Methylosinus sp. KRF6]
MSVPPNAASAASAIPRDNAEGCDFFNSFYRKIATAPIVDQCAFLVALFDFSIMTPIRRIGRELSIGRPKFARDANVFALAGGLLRPYSV